MDGKRSISKQVKNDQTMSWVFSKKSGTNPRIYQTLPHELFEELWNHCVPETTLLAQDEEPFTTNHSIFV
jgi:hypothetical protein